MFNINNQWNKLNTCIVGRVYYPQFFTNSAELQTVAKETEEDLSDLCKILEEHDVTVIRPDLDSSDKITNYEQNNVPKPPIAPRDAHVVIGTTLFEFGNTHTSIHNIFKDQQVLRSMFAPSRNDSNCPAPSITQLNDTILIDNKEFSRWEIQWIKKNLSSTYKIVEISVGGHNDGSFIFVQRNTVVSLPNIFNQIYNVEINNAPYKKYTRDDIDKEVHVLEINHDGWSTCAEWLTKRKINQGRWWLPGQEGNVSAQTYVNEWINNWTGFAAESVFSLNALMINPNKIIINTKRDDVVTFLKEHDIECIVSPMRHQYFWDNGIHCMTLDLNRD